MSEHQKETVVSFIASIMVTIPYLFYTLNRFNSNSYTSSEELKFWASALLLIIPIRIVVHIVLFIAFSIIKSIVTGKEDKDVPNDERDMLIELKGDRNATNAFAFGMIAAMLAVVFGGSLSTMFVIMIVGGFISEMISIVSKMFYYKNGF